MSAEAELIARDIKLVGGLLIPASAGTGKILTSDANGNANWQSPSSGVTDPSAVAFISPAFNNTNNRYSTIASALSATTGAITLVIYPGTYSMPDINTARNVAFIAIGEVSLTAGNPTNMNGDSVFSGAGLTLTSSGSAGSGFYFVNGNAIFDCKKINCQLSFAAANGYANCKFYNARTLVQTYGYTQFFELNTQRIGENSDIVFEFNSDSSIRAAINAQKARVNINVQNAVELDVGGGIYECNSGRMLTAGGSGYDVYFKTRSNNVNVNSFSGGQAIAASGNGTIDCSYTKWKSGVASVFFTGEYYAKINAIGCLFKTPTPSQNPFGSSGVLIDSTTTRWGADMV